MYSTEKVLAVPYSFLVVFITAKAATINPLGRRVLGTYLPKNLSDQIIQDLNDQRIKKQGLTLSGGDPLHPANVAEVLKLVKRVKTECVAKDIWMWTGYLLADLNVKQKQIIELVDVLIDGKFEKDLADPSLAWRGSSNQVIHYL